MAFRMPGVIFIDGNAYLNVRVPTDIAHAVRGTYVKLPVDSATVDTKISDKVSISLRTKNKKTAWKRGKLASAVLDAHFDAVRAASTTTGDEPLGTDDGTSEKPTVSLTHRQIVALAGESYRGMVGGARADEPGDFGARERAHEEAVRAWQRGDEPGKGPRLARSDAEYLAVLQLPSGPEWLTWRNGGDLHDGYVSLSYREALEHLFGDEADRLCKGRDLRLDDDTRLKLLFQIGQATIVGTGRLMGMAAGDLSADPHLARFPTFDRAARVTVAILFERWTASNTDVVQPSTIRRYTPSINSLASYLKDKDVRGIDQDDIWSWAEHRRDVDRIKARTVNRNDLVAATSLFTFATTRDGKRLRPDNPVLGVKLTEPKRSAARVPFFKPAEIRKILNLARAVRVGGRYAKAAASRRWVPWICAYSGARVQEPLWLKKEDVVQDAETGTWTMTFSQTKSGNARCVPLHEALVAEGFLDYWKEAPDGWLFVGDIPSERPRTDRSIQEYRASELAAWIQKHLKLEDGVDPNHGWRHTFITRATGKMEKRIANAICGHNEKRDVSDGYFTATISEMKTGLDCYPPYQI